MIAAYCWPQSVRARERVALFVHTDAAHLRVSVERQGAEDALVARYDRVGGHEQCTDGALSVDGCDWTPSLELDVDSAWPSGFYLVRCVAEDGETCEAFFVVRAQERGRALWALSTSTWAAYNDWHGPSFYTGGHLSATRRPLPRGFLDRPQPDLFRAARLAEVERDTLSSWVRAGYSMWSVAAGWAGWERRFARWAERAGIELDYAVSHDLDRGPEILDSYSAYLSVGHDEYWSAGMRDTVERFVESGGNAAFFSGNTAFWQIRFEADYGRVVGYKLDFAEDPVHGTERAAALSTMWSDPLVGRPENEMTGVSFTRGGYAHMRNAPQGTGGYTVWRPDHWVFEGLGLTRGDTLGDAPVVVGYECDGCELRTVDGLPEPTGRDGTPASFEVLGTAPAHLWETAEGVGLPDTYRS